MSDQKYVIEYSKSGRASCKRCKLKLEKDSLRVGKVVDMNGNESKSWWHPECFGIHKNLEACTADQIIQDCFQDDEIQLLLASDLVKLKGGDFFHTAAHFRALKKRQKEQEEQDQAGDEGGRKKLKKGSNVLVTDDFKKAKKTVKKR